MAKSVTNLGDVAAAAGVSKSTVSRVLNNKLGNGFAVSSEVRQRILEIAVQLRYRPNLMARGLTNQRTRMVSVLGGSHALSDMGNIYQTVINSITNVLDNAPGGFDVTVDMSQHALGTSELPAWKIDGAIILAKCTSQTIEEIKRSNVPYVVINGPADSSGSSVSPDDIGGMELAVQHLVQLGHTRIAYASAPLRHLAGHSSLKDRHDTYVKELNARGLETIKGHEEPFTSAVDYLKSAVVTQKATAIIAYGHMGALNIMQAAHSLGIAIPRELSLIAFCDEYAASVMSPGLTFIDLGSREMGRIAAEMLLEKIENPDQAQSRNVKIQEKLVFRDTTARPCR
ncbi:MAG: LacI family DNA-binding transcriptional regulator [Sedimentisphaerales bacterium]